MIAFASALALCVVQVGEAQPSLPNAYFLGLEDRNGDGVSDLSDGLNLYAVANGQTSRLNTPAENVRNYLPDFDSGEVAYVAQTAEQGATLTRLNAESQRQSITLTGLKTPLLQRCAAVIWLTAQDIKGQFLLLGYDLTLTEVARAVIPMSSPLIAFDPTGHWVTAYDQSTRKLRLYSLPGLALIPLPTPLTPWGPPVWARHSARLAVPVSDFSVPTRIKIMVIDPPTDLRTGADPELSSDTTSLVQAQWSANENYLTYRTLPGTALAAALPLRLINTRNLSIATNAENDAQLRVVNWSDDDQYALVSEASSPLSDAISVNYRIFKPAENQFMPGDQISALIAPVAFAWQPHTHVLGILGTSLVDGKAGIFTFDVESAILSTLYTADKVDILKGNIFWSGDGSSLLFTAQLTDPLSQLAGNGNTLRVLDIRTANTVILSPDDVTVLPYGIQVR